MTVLLEDPALLRRFRAGDRQALEIVYRRFVRDVWALMRMGFPSSASGVRVPGITDRALLSDSVQARVGYDGLRPYRPYLLRIARNVRIDQLRKSGREVLLGDAGSSALDLDALVEANAPVPELDEELSAATRAYVETLDPEAQRFVQLRFAEDRHQLEVAEQMSVSRRRVRTLEARVLSGLRKALRLKQQG